MLLCLEHSFLLQSRGEIRISNSNTLTSAISYKAVHQWKVADDLEKKVTSLISN